MKLAPGRSSAIKQASEWPRPFRRLASGIAIDITATAITIRFAWVASGRSPGGSNERDLSERANSRLPRG
jgi:hypothetical protein